MALGGGQDDPAFVWAAVFTSIGIWKCKHKQQHLCVMFSAPNPNAQRSIGSQTVLFNYMQNIGMKSEPAIWICINKSCTMRVCSHLAWFWLLTPVVWMHDQFNDLTGAGFSGIWHDRNARTVMVRTTQKPWWKFKSGDTSLDSFEVHCTKLLWLIIKKWKSFEIHKQG